MVLIGVLLIFGGEAFCIFGPHERIVHLSCHVLLYAGMVLVAVGAVLHWSERLRAAPATQQWRPWVGVLGGLATWLILGAAGLGVLHVLWPDYARAEPNKAYTFGMLIARLTISLICSATAGAVAAKMARKGSGAAWWLGVLLLAGSAPIHLVTVWADYPAWYHILYLLPLMPVTGLSGAWVSAMPSRRA